jgi:hypothetical protein
MFVSFCFIVERTEEQEDVHNTQNTNEEWDFDDPASPKPPTPTETQEDNADSFKKPRAVSFGERFASQGNITRKDTVASASSLNEDSVKSERARVSFTEKPALQDPSALPKKSRFVVDNPNATVQSSRTDSSSSATEIPQISSQLLPAEVKKGRFSVIDNPNQPPVSEKVSVTSKFPAPVSNTSLSVPTLPEALAISPLSSPLPATATNEPFSGDTSTSSPFSNLVERKAGRFAFQNLPTSAVTSPTLAATEGPKIPRKFTIVSESSATAAQPPLSPAISGQGDIIFNPRQKK